ncbi:hypothetical protein HanXRQr2_Chr05g0214751 [Helianthus annuus]|uniref:Uncharacterized protein n=1 Tax=Helianthus annuus TaxID=4232 RepID=A0A251UQV1_HELAN|nr:hypothetical protein HanXRQr2_Chr05g0214751 [Helianthus annuus]
MSSFFLCVYIYICWNVCIKVYHVKMVNCMLCLMHGSVEYIVVNSEHRTAIAFSVAMRQ